MPEGPWPRERVDDEHEDDDDDEHEDEGCNCWIAQVPWWELNSAWILCGSIGFCSC